MELKEIIEQVLADQMPVINRHLATHINTAIEAHRLAPKGPRRARRAPPGNTPVMICAFCNEYDCFNGCEEAHSQKPHGKGEFPDTCRLCVAATV